MSSPITRTVNAADPALRRNKAADVSVWFTLSDEGIEDAIYDSYAFRKFMKVDFLGEEQVPDATTLCKFRKLLNKADITKMSFDSMKTFRQSRCLHQAPARAVRTLCHPCQAEPRNP